MVAQGQYYNPLPALYLFPRGDDFNEIRLYERYNTNYGFMEQYWPYDDGGLSLQNPYWTQNRILRTSDKKRYMMNASLKWNVTDWFNITGRVNLDNSDYRNQTEKYASTLNTKALVKNFKDVMSEEEITNKLIVTENFESVAAAMDGGFPFTDQYGNSMKSLEGMARWKPENGFEKGGVGTYHMEAEYPTNPEYKNLRRAIQIMNPSSRPLIKY